MQIGSTYETIADLVSISRSELGCQIDVHRHECSDIIVERRSSRSCLLAVRKGRGSPLLEAHLRARALEVRDEVPHVLIENFQESAKVTIAANEGMLGIGPALFGPRWASTSRTMN